MLRWMMPLLIAMFAVPFEAEAAGPAGKAAARRAATQLPPGLPRAHYKFRTSVAPPSAQALYDGPDVMFTPSPRYVRYAPPAVALVPGPVYVPWPGYFGPSVAYEYRVPLYAGPYGLYGYRCGIDTYGNSYC